ncbi:hypothetical protein ACOMHN_000934 [Nucella lapillus]
MAQSIPKMKLWFYPKFRSTRCVWLIKELEIEEQVEYNYIDIITGAKTSTPEYLEYRKSVHPHGWVPALETEGRPPMLESGAICLYLADLCGRLVPEPKDRSEYFSWVFYCTSTLDGAMATLSRQWMFTPEALRDQEVIAKAKALVDQCLDRLDTALQGRTFILGEQFSAADCVVGYSVLWASVLNKQLLLEGRPNLLAYLSTIMTRPALQQALALDKP